MGIPEKEPNPRDKPRYRWPWLVAGAILLALLLAFLWMSREVERTRLIRELNQPGQK